MADPNPQRSAQAAPIQPEAVAPQRSRKRKLSNTSRSDAQKKYRGKGKGKGKGTQKAGKPEESLVISSDDEDEGMSTAGSSSSRRRSTRTRKVVAGGYRDDDDGEDDEGPEYVDVDVPISNQTEDSLPAVKDEEPDIDLYQPNQEDMPDPDDDYEIEERRPDDIPSAPPAFLKDPDEDEDVKPKPLMRLRYQGLHVNDRCLCVIVEPRPPLNASERGASMAPAPPAPRAPSIAPADFVASTDAARNTKLPLFLPDFDRGRSETPAPFPLRASVPPGLDGDGLYTMEEDEMDDMMAFGEVLRSGGEYAAGGVEDDDEMDGAVFFGDADEFREFS